MVEICQQISKECCCKYGINNFVSKFWKWKALDELNN
jgi:hypothetical protein